MMVEPCPDVLVAHLAGEAVLLNLSDKSYYRLNETAAAVWVSLEQRESREALLNRLVSTFEIDRPQAEIELDELLADLLKKTLVRVRFGEN